MKLKMDKGFTLLELMIASAVIIVALTGLLATYISCLELTETTKNTNLALNHAQRVLEEIRSASFTGIYSTYNGYTFNVSGIQTNSSVGYVDVNNTNSSLLAVTIGVCWRQKSSRIIGECQDSGGVVSFTDSNGNSVLDSPVQLATLMAQR